MILAHHGVIVCGDRMDYAFDDLYYLERSCMVQVLAQSTGKPLRNSRTRSCAQVSQADRRRASAVRAALRGAEAPAGSRRAGLERNEALMNS